MLRFLEKLPPNTRVAVFLLEHKLHVVQGFTTDPAILHAALQRVVSPTTNEKYPQEDPDSLSNLETEAGVPKGPGLEDAEKRWLTAEAILRRAIKRSHSQQFLGQIMPSAKQERASGTGGICGSARYSLETLKLVRFQGF